MKSGLPTQMIWQSRLHGGGVTQDPASMAWNIFTALFYKGGNIPLTQAGSDDILVIYDVEDPCYKKRARPGSCGNFDVQYWAVYSRARNTYKAVAFGMAPNERIDNVTIENGLIVADVYTYAPMDPNCCPSIDTKTFFKVANARIKPILPRGISNKARKGSATLF